MSTTSASPPKHSPTRAVRGRREPAQLAHDAQQIAREAVAHLRDSARRAAEIGVETVAALLFEDERENFLFQISLLVELALRVVFRQARVGRFKTLIQLHQRSHPAVSGAQDSPVMPDQDATQHAGQMLTAFGIAAQPEKISAARLGRSLLTPRWSSTGQIPSAAG